MHIIHIHYFNGVKFSDVNVEWNTTTSNGHVKSVDYLGDSNWYCWDSNKVNIECSVKTFLLKHLIKKSRLSPGLFYLSILKYRNNII